MKVAIVQDELIRRAGGERVGLCIHYAFPEAPLYTIAYREDDTFPEYKNCNVKTSWFNKLVKNESDLKRYFFPFGILAMKQLDLTAYDIIIQSGTHCSKYVKVNNKALVITYCYTPFRLAWNPRSYSEYIRSKGIKRAIFNVVVNILKRIDKKSAERTDYFLGMTRETAERIKAAYTPLNDITIIPPPVTIKNFYISETQDEYYFLLSRLEFYKKVDLVVKAFNLTGKKLIIVGRGSKEKELKEMANSNIQFYSGLSQDEIAKFYSKCRAFLMPQHEDYGITPLEANASGRPVIAYSKGGVLETMIPYKGDSKKCTAIFFEEQTVECLINAINQFETLEFDPQFIRDHSSKFDDKIFIDKVKDFTVSASNNIL